MRAKSDPNCSLEGPETHGYLGHPQAVGDKADEGDVDRLL